MLSSLLSTRTSRNLAVTCLLGCLLGGCTVAGPSSLRGGRLAYNEAIIETDNQQMLLAVVLNRYGERTNLLAVTSITANVRVAANAGIEAGAGDSDNYSGNLVPFSAGVIYEENPTISYVPVGGEQYARQLMSPVSVEVLGQLAGNLIDTAPVYYTLVSSINGIYNPDFSAGTSTTDTRFIRLVKIIAELTRAHRLHWVRDQQQDSRFSIVIYHYSRDYAREVGELLRLLGLPAPEKSAPPIVLPVSLALDGQDTGSIGITTRSVFDLLQILSGAVEIPEQDLATGVAISYPPPGLVGKALRIHHAKTRPDNASVAVNYRNGWFYIDETDQATKQFFKLLTTLLEIDIAESTDRESAPVLTVPVSR